MFKAHSNPHLSFQWTTFSSKLVPKTYQTRDKRWSWNSDGTYTSFFVLRTKQGHVETLLISRRRDKSILKVTPRLSVQSEGRPDGSGWDSQLSTWIEIIWLSIDQSVIRTQRSALERNVLFSFSYKLPIFQSSADRPKAFKIQWQNFVFFFTPMSQEVALLRFLKNFPLAVDTE